MRTVFATLGVFVLTSGIAAAQDQGAAEKALIANETKVNEAVAKGDKAAFSALVAPDATMADGNGIMKVSEFLPALDQVRITTWKIVAPAVQWVDANTAVVVYTWTGLGTWQGQKLPAKTYASTVWTKKADRWVAVYHQESAAVAPPTPKPSPAKKQ